MYFIQQTNVNARDSEDKRADVRTLKLSDRRCYVSAMYYCSPSNISHSFENEIFILKMAQVLGPL